MRPKAKRKDTHWKRFNETKGKEKGHTLEEV